MAGSGTSGAGQSETYTAPTPAASERRGDLGDRARLTLVILSALPLVITVGHWALTVIGFLSSEAGRFDFSSYYAAALALRENIHANIYSAVTMAQAGAQGQTLVNPPLPYTYPPLLAILLSPFTVLSFRVLSRGWLLGNVGIWAALIFVFAALVRYLLGDALVRQPQRVVVATAPGSVPARGGGQTGQAALLADPTPLVALALAALVSLGFAPAYQTVMTGQVNFLVLAPLALIPALSSGRHERWVGVMVALAAMLKFTPIILIAYLLLRRRWAAAISAVVALAALSLLCIVIVGPGVFFAALPQALHVGAGDASLNHNEALLAPLAVALGPAVGGSAAFKLGEYAVLGLLALAVGYILWRAPSPGPISAATTADADRYARAAMRAHNEVEALAYSVALCAMVLLSPTAWVHHYVWLLPAALIALGVAGRRALLATERDRWRAWGVLALATLATLALGWGLPYGWDTDPHPHHITVAGITLWPGALELRPLGGLALLVALTILLAGYATGQASRRGATSDAAGSASQALAEPAPAGSTTAEAKRARPAASPTPWAPVPANALPRLPTDDQ